MLDHLHNHIDLKSIKKISDIGYETLPILWNHNLNLELSIAVFNCVNGMDQCYKKEFGKTEPSGMKMIKISFPTPIRL